MGENFLLVGAILLFVAVLAGKAAYRLGAPALLLFLGVGIFFGYGGHYSSAGCFGRGYLLRI